MDNNTEIRVNPDFTCEELARSQIPGHTLCVLLIVIFIGILLTLTANFGISAFLGNAGEYVDYYDGLAHDDIVLQAFSDNLYRSPAIRERIVRYDYVLFRELPDGNVILGEDDFLFEKRDPVTGYDYIRDFVGEGTPDDAELDRMEGNVRGLLARFRAEGKDAVLAVIPNSQTVYPEKMPDYFGRISPYTALGCLDRRLADEPGWLDLTDALRAAKEKGQTYNNTENSLNALGAYYAYRAVYDALPEHITAELTPLREADISFPMHHTEGKALAREVGLSDLILNHTLSLSSDFPRPYSMLERISSVEMTYSNVEDRDRLPLRPALLMEFTSEWDRILMTDYFSGTFGLVGYTSAWTGYSPRALEVASPDAVIIFVHEYELREQFG